MKKTSLDKKFDKLRFLEENNKLVSKDQNRLISKFLNNKLAPAQTDFDQPRLGVFLKQRLIFLLF